jgi:anthranilate phosphoribosyltransferase
MLATLRALGAEHALVFHGDDGLDELTTTTTNTVHELVNGAVKTYRVDPTDFGLERVDATALRGGSADENANAVRAVLAGEKGAHRDITLLNAAAALVVAGIASDLGAGLEAAAAAIDSGAAERTLAAMVATSASAGD